MITAYDYTSGLLCDQAGADILLVGDSVGMVVLGHDTTVPVTMDDMIHHVKAVRRSTQRPLIVGDMPFGSYLDPASAATNACRLIKEGGCDAVKLEGGVNMVSRVRAITNNGMAVQGHIGLLPQHVNSIGGYRVQGKTSVDAMRLMEDALALQEAGCFSIVLEMVPDEVAYAITNALDIPTIGIGAGPRTSGQVQVFHDVVGLYDKLVPKFSKQYATLSVDVTRAVGEYCDEVRSGEFPTIESHSFTMPSVQLELFREEMEDQYPTVTRRMVEEKEEKEKKEKKEKKMQEKEENALGGGGRLASGVSSEHRAREQAMVASSILAEQWRRSMIQSYHQEARTQQQLQAPPPTTMLSSRRYSSLSEQPKSSNSEQEQEGQEGQEQEGQLVVVRDIDNLRSLRRSLLLHRDCSSSSSTPPTIGFVPTMGSLHEGHLSLIRRAKECNDIVIVSIYVNPTQFNANDDLDVYPRVLEQDVSLLKEMEVDVVYAPSESLYHRKHQTWVLPDIDGSYDEGSSRPGFFRGVATVVTKLLQQVQPNVVYFGQKDAQQCAVLQDLVRDLDIGIMTGENGMQVEIVPTVREHDGLAMSSRNAYLSEEERKLAPGLYQALQVGSEVVLSGAADGVDNDVTVTVGDVKRQVLEYLNENGINEVEYVTVADVRTTAPMSDDQGCGDGYGGAGRLMIATSARIGTTRLIDNIVV